MAETRHVTTASPLIGSAQCSRRVVAGDLVTVHYTGSFLSGEEFDSSYAAGEPLQFVAGAGRLIRGRHVSAV